MNIHAIALWTGIGASLVGMAGGYVSIHNDLQKQREDLVTQAAQRQQRIDALNQRLDQMDQHLNFIDATLPAHEQELARRIFAQVKLQVQQAQVQQPVMYDMKGPRLAEKKRTVLSVPTVSADLPKEEKPQ